MTAVRVERPAPYVVHPGKCAAPAAVHPTENSADASPPVESTWSAA